MKLKYAIALTALTALVAAPVLADDYNPPPWRGQSGTTFARWEFLTNDSTPPPESGWVNPYSLPDPPTMLVEPYPDDPGWYAQYLGREGVWLLSGEIWIDIANDPQWRPHKCIRIQITWSPMESGDHPAAEEVITPNAPHRADLVQEETLGDWKRSTFLIRLSPNPSAERIHIYGDVYVDEVVVDTICTYDDLCPAIPTVSEWGLIVLTLLLLTAGTIIFGQQRRRLPQAV